MRLHLGCGKRFFEGYIHVDIADFEHIDYKNPVHDLGFASNESVDEIYCSHCLEYYDLDESLVVLKEWHRVLKKDAMLYLGVPDFDALIDIYKATKNLDFIIGPLYGRMKCNEKFIYHKSTFNYDKLKLMLEESSFKEISQWNWQEHPMSHVDDHIKAYFPHMNQKGRLVSLNVKAKKY